MTDLCPRLHHWRTLSLPCERAVCHAWRKDLSMLACCDGSPEVHIFSISVQNDNNGDLRHIATLKEHNQAVSAMQWASSGLLVTCSHDRTSYVWKQDKKTGSWTPQTVMMKLQRAALCVAWSPSEDKFAIGSGTKNVCVCSYDRKFNWWAGSLIRKEHNSSVCCVAWNPDDACLATGSTDGRCRIFWASTSGDENQNRKFGALLYCVDLGCWVNSISWSPNGSVLVAAGHDANIHLIERLENIADIRVAYDGTYKAVHVQVKLPSLPAQSIAHTDSAHVIAAGWDGVLYTIKNCKETDMEGSTWLLHSTHGQTLADQFQRQFVAKLGRKVTFEDSPAEKLVSGVPFHQACVQELKFLMYEELQLLASLDRNGGLSLWLWGSQFRA